VVDNRMAVNTWASTQQPSGISRSRDERKTAVGDVRRHSTAWAAGSASTRSWDESSRHQLNPTILRPVLFGCVGGHWCQEPDAASVEPGASTPKPDVSAATTACARRTALS